MTTTEVRIHHQILEYAHRLHEASEAWIRGVNWHRLQPDTRERFMSQARLAVEQWLLSGGRFQIRHVVTLKRDASGRFTKTGGAA